MVLCVYNIHKDSRLQSQKGEDQNRWRWPWSTLGVTEDENCTKNFRYVCRLACIVFCVIFQDIVLIAVTISFVVRSNVESRSKDWRFRKLLMKKSQQQEFVLNVWTLNDRDGNNAWRHWNHLVSGLSLLLFHLPIFYCSTNPIMWIVVNTANLDYYHTQHEYLLVNWDMEVVWKRRTLLTS